MDAGIDVLDKEFTTAEFNLWINKLSNINFDTGERTVPTEYDLADKSYGEWFLKLQDKNFQTISPAIKQNILNFYDDNKAGLLTKQKLKQAPLSNYGYEAYVRFDQKPGITLCNRTV